MNLDLRGRAAIVTGASRGLGAATALALAAEGVDVALISRNGEDLATVASDIERTHDVRTVVVAADLTDPTLIEAAIGRVAHELGGVDILVNNAGASPAGRFDACTDAEWVDAVELKLLGYVRVIRSVLPIMRRRGRGRIVNVVGLSGRQASPGYVLGALNAALLHLTRSLAIELAPEQITVVSVNPHLVETDRVAGYFSAQAETMGVDLESMRDQVRGTTPLRRFGTADEVARMITIMASDVMEYATGSALLADGANGLSL